MFGTKQNKQNNLQKFIAVLRTKGEATQTELSSELRVSPDAIEDYLIALDDQGIKLCQKGRKISLLEHWNGNKDG